MSHRPLGILYLVFALMMAVMGIAIGLPGVLFLWIAATFTMAGLAYTLGKPELMGKRLDGSLSASRRVLMLPYLPLAIAAALLRWHRGESTWNEVAPNLFVGRRASAAELPEGTTAVVDLTCEFEEPMDVRTGRVYRCLPTLDGCASELTAFSALAREVSTWSHRTYVHCAVGHGRSAALAAAVIVLRGQAKDASEAEAIMKKARPGVDLSREQRSLVDAATRRSAAPSATPPGPRLEAAG